MAEVATGVATAGTSPTWQQEDPGAWEEFRTMLAANDPESYARLAEVVADIDVGAELAGIEVPVLLLGGNLDAPSPPALNEANAARLARGSFVELTDCGHIAPLERPEEVLQAVQAFLSANGIRPSGAAQSAR